MNNELPEILMLNGQPVRTAELLEANADDEEIINAIKGIQPGQTLQFGGGAAPIMTIVRPNEVHGGLFIFLYTNERGFILKVYRGRATKPMAFYRFRTEHERAGYLLRIKNDETARVQRVEHRKAERKAVTCELAVGDVLHYSWGYEQTNCDFFQVIGLTPKGVKIREITSRPVPSAHDDMKHNMACNMEAVPNAFLADAPVLTKRMSTATSVKMDHGNASKWDGKPKYCSWYA
jgi:hypothetical protein